MIYDKEMINAERRNELRSKLEAVSMPEKNKIVLRTRFGIDDGIYRSLPETAKIFSMTAEGVRQIEQKFYSLVGEK